MTTARGASQITSALLWLTSVERTLVGESGSAKVGHYRHVSRHKDFLLVFCFFLAGLLTGGFFSHQWLALHPAIDGIDVKAVERARLQVGDVGVRVG